MAKGDAPVLEALADINTVSLKRTELDPASFILVRLAAVIVAAGPRGWDRRRGRACTARRALWCLWFNTSSVLKAWSR
jgi:hypothetical protein